MKFTMTVSTKSDRSAKKYSQKRTFRTKECIICSKTSETSCSSIVPDLPHNSLIMNSETLIFMKKGQNLEKYRIFKKIILLLVP